MTIVASAPPQRKSGGRQRRISDEDLKSLADVLSSDPGAWALDDEECDTRSCAHQRAAAAIKALEQDYEIKAKKATKQTDDGHFVWLLGNVTPEDEAKLKARKSRKSDKTKTEAPASA